MIFPDLFGKLSIEQSSSSRYHEKLPRLYREEKLRLRRRLGRKQAMDALGVIA